MSLTYSVQVSPKNLALFRIAFGLAICFHLTVYVLPGVNTYFFPNGLISESLVNKLSAFKAISIFDFFTTPDATISIFVLTYFLLGCFIVGFYARIAGIILTFLLWNIFQRCFLAGGAERIYCMCVLIITNFLNLDQVWAVKKNVHPTRHQSFALRVISVQIGMIYLCSALLKSDQAWFNGDILNKITADPLNAHFFWQNVHIINSRVLSISLVVTECIVGILFLIYFRSKTFQLLAVLFLIACHCSILIFLNLWHFGFYAFAIASLFFPFNNHKYQKIPSIKTTGNVVSKALLILILLIITVKNGSALYFSSYYPKSLRYKPITHLCHFINRFSVSNASPFNQRWDLYGKLPERFGCLILVGNMSDSTNVNLITGGKVMNVCCHYNNLSQKEHLEIIRMLYFNINIELLQHPMDVLKTAYADYYKRKFNTTFNRLEWRFYYINNGELTYKVLFSYVE